MLQVFYWPKLPRPGDTVQVEAHLDSRSETPVNGVRFRFTGIEARPDGDSASSGFHTYFDLVADSGPLLLAAGARISVPTEFVLPEGIPPSYRSARSRVEYRLDVRIEVPWWPDRIASYLIPVGPSPLAAQPRRLSSRTYATEPTGPRGKELLLELTLDSTDAELGGEVTGAVSVENVAHHRVRQLIVTGVIVDAAVGLSALGSTEIYRTASIVLAGGAPKAGLAYPFRLRLPADAPPTFVGKVVSVRWHVEARAVVRLGKDAQLSPRIDVVAPAGVGAAERAPAVRTAPVGRERRALVWAAVAQSTGLICDAEHETMGGKFGSVALQVLLEADGDQLYSIATLAWPSLGLDIHLGERRWRDALGGAVPLGDARFDARFAARSREQAQLHTLLAREVRDELLAFERVIVDDDGAALGSPGNGYNVDDLEPFVRDAVAAALALEAAIERMPPPAALAVHRDAWLAQAQRLGGRLEVGGFAIRDVKYRGAAVELVTRFDATGGPEASVARVRLTTPRDADPRPEDLPPEAQRILRSLAAECQQLRVTRDAVEASLPAPLAEPARAESLWRALLRVAKALDEV